MTNDEGMTKADDRQENEEAFWLDDKTAFVREEPDVRLVYDLEERTARFGEAVIDFTKTIPQGPTTDRIISQLVGAATSVGANYVEADDSVSKKEFLKCIGTCKKEARETKHFLRMDRTRGSRIESRSAKVVDGSERTASHFFEDLEKWKK